MNTTVQYHDLPLSERIRLVEDIWDSIAAEADALPALSPSERAEMQRRLEAHRKDPSSSLPWDEVRAELRDR